MAKVNSGALPKVGIQNIVSGKFSITQEVKTGLLSERVNVAVLVFCLFFELFQFVLIGVFWNKFPPQIPLFYSKPWGDGVLASPIALWILPLLALFYIILNFTIAIIIFKSEKFLARVIVFTSGLVSFISFYAVFKIITLLL